MSGSTQHTVVSNADYETIKYPQPDVGLGSGVDVAVTALGAGGTMAALATASQNGFYLKEALKDSDITIFHVGPEFGSTSFYLDFPQHRF